MNNTKTTFNPGDIVQLKSGGPDMVVTYFDPPDLPNTIRFPGQEDSCVVGCMWFDLSNHVNVGNFLEETLILKRQDNQTEEKPVDATDPYYVNWDEMEDWVQAVAVDEDGRVHSYREPTVDHGISYWCFNKGHGRWKYLKTLPPEQNPDWKNSKRIRPGVE